MSNSSVELNRPSLSQTINALTDLALDLRWSYNHSADKLWEQIDPELWDLTHNAWAVLQTAAREKLERVSADPQFQTLLNRVRQEHQAALASETWFQKTHRGSSLTGVAYFSMEFMLSGALPIYSGGLGNVAGDQLKAASNLGVPVTAIGLLYQQGYFRQEIDAHGRQQALYPYNDPGQLPIQPLRDAHGEWVRLSVEFPATKIWVRTWRVRVGRTQLYLLDTNDPANMPAYRGITSELYGGDSELRLAQEMLLGLGGWRLLRTLGLHPEVCHLNEGHAAFAVLERARSYMLDHQVPFDVALTITRPGNLFTTHTPVAAGFDRFAPELMQKHFRRYAEEGLAIHVDDLLALGRQNRNDSAEPFNMAYLAIRGSGAVNGVSRLHGEVSRRIFQSLFPRWPEIEVPVTYVTNGVHVPTWDSAQADRLWERAGGKQLWQGDMIDLERDLGSVEDAELWQLRTGGRKTLVDYVRKTHARQVAGRGASPEDVALAGQRLDPNTLTLGFARRFATYKRPNLLLHDVERLARILTNRDNPVQLVLAGKAHPQDLQGQDMIRQWIEFAYRADVRPHLVFLSDYDALMAEQLVHGVDVWVNTPRRPWEASGTSGMKVLVNGGLNLSELDGWWAEAYSPEVGWALGDGREHGDDPNWDAAEAEALYSLIERQVVPQFYARDEHGVPRAWVSKMRQSMARLTPTFSTNRVVRQYTEDHYLGAAERFRERAANPSLGVDLLRWQHELNKHWPMLRFGSAHVQQEGNEHVFQVQAFLDDLDPNAVGVELYAEGKNGAAAVRHSMTRGDSLVGSVNGFTFTARIPADRPVSDFTPRVVPIHRSALVPLEAPFVLWHESPSWRH
jgi:starch phosphorylase